MPCDALLTLFDGEEMKRLLFMPSLGYGGCEEFSVQLLELLDAMGEPTVSCIPAVAGTAELRKRIADTRGKNSDALGGLPSSWLCGEASDPYWPQDPEQYVEAMTLLDRVRPQQIIAVLPDPVSAFGFIEACVALAIPTVVIFQLCEGPFVVPKHLLPLGPNVRLISVSAAARGIVASAFHVAPDRITVLPNVSRRRVNPGVLLSGNAKDDWAEVAATTPSQTPQPRAMTLRLATHLRVLTVARITEQKGSGIYPAIVGWVKKRHPGVAFIWVGEGEDRETLTAALDRYNLLSCVTLAGHQCCVEDWYRNADLFLLPSLWEGTPLSLTEAMYSGCPIVTTRVGGVSELLDSTQAWLVTPDDVRRQPCIGIQSIAERLGEAIVTALSNPIDRHRRARNARKRWHTLNDNGLRLLASVLGISLDSLHRANELLNRHDR